MSRVVIGNAYFLQLDPARWAERQPFPPLGTLYAAGALRSDGYEVHLFDAMLAAGADEWQDLLARIKPDIAVLFDDNFNYLSKMCLAAMRDAATAMVAAAAEAGIKVAVCSADASDNPQVYLAAGADAVILGEGDATLRELVARWSAGEDGIAAVPGVAWLDDASKVARTIRRAPLRDLDHLPRPAWDLVEIDRYRRIWHQHHGHFALNLVTSRGCPYACNWCAKPIWGQSYAVRPPEDVAAELALLVELAAPDYIWFMDDIMGLKPRWWGAFADELERRELRVPFKCLSRADLVLREGAVEDLRRAGCDIVWMGAESGSQKILDAMDKGLTVGEIAEATAQLQKAGIRVGHFLQFGYPGEGMHEIGATLAMLRKTRPDEIGISVSYPLPGTVFYERVQNQLRDKRNWTVSSDLAMLYQGPFTSRFYRVLHIYVHLEFRLHRALRRLGALASGRSGPRWAHLRACAVVGWCVPALPVLWMGLQFLRVTRRFQHSFGASQTI